MDFSRSPFHFAFLMPFSFSSPLSFTKQENYFSFSSCFVRETREKIKIKFSYAAGNCINFAKCSEKFSNFAFHFTIAATFLRLAETFLLFSNHFLVGKLSSRLSESVENWRPHTRAAQWKLKFASLFESSFSRGTIFRHIFFLFYALRKRENVYNFVSLIVGNFPCNIQFKSSDLN